MRILFFADNFKPETNAPATHIYERCRYWVQWGHEVTVITCVPNFPEGKVFPGYKNRLHQVEYIDGIKVVRVWSYVTANEGFLRRTLDYLSYVPTALLSSLFEERPDVVISSSPQFFTAVAGVASSLLLGVPHVFELRDLWPGAILETTNFKKGFVFQMLENLELNLYQQSRRIISFTRSYVEDLTSRGVPENKIDIVINGASLDLFSPAKQRDAELEKQLGLQGRFVIGYLGTWGLAHQLENVIHAASLLQDQPISFLFVGGGAAREVLEKELAAHNLKNVLLIPRVDKKELSRYWSLCDVSLVHLKDTPMYTTVIPSKIFESMAVGLPILFVGPECDTRSEGAEIVRKHNAGLIVPAAQPEQLAAAAMRYYRDPALRVELAKNSLAAAPLYSRKTQAERSLNVLYRALGSNISLDQAQPMPSNGGH